MSAKTTYQRSAKGPVSINECSADGKYVQLENTGRRVCQQVTTITRTRSVTPVNVQPAKQEQGICVRDAIKAFVIQSDTDALRCYPGCTVLVWVVPM